MKQTKNVYKTLPVAPTYTDEECDQKPLVSCSTVAWRLSAHNMPEDIGDNLDHPNQFLMGIYVCKLPSVEISTR